MLGLSKETLNIQDHFPLCLAILYVPTLPNSLIMHIVSP